MIDKWKIDFNTYMASGLSYIVLEVDGYGTGGQGEEHEKKIKEMEFAMLKSFRYNSLS